jgi:hypothetical protein
MTTETSLRFEANADTSNMLRDVFAELNEHYSKPERTVLQIVGFETADDAGELGAGLIQKRLGLLTPVRVLIDPATDPTRVVELLRNITEWFKIDHDEMGKSPLSDQPFGNPF